MRIIRFVDQDGRVRQGLENGDGTATLIKDQAGALGLPHRSTLRARFKRKVVLVADDDANMRRLVETVLDKAGCECVVCADGQEALDALEREPIEIVVCDIAMPHHNGYEIFSAARERRHDMPIVLITGFGYDPNHTLVRAAREGHDIVLYKPFTPQQLLAEIGRALEVMNGAVIDGLQPSEQQVRVGRVLSPLHPPDIVCIGRNYGDHDITDDDLDVFIKPSSSLLGPGEAIRIPAFDDDPQVECAGELAIVIGRTAKDVPRDQAMKHIVGYTAANDVTARRWQTAAGNPRWMRGKGFDTFCPLGPSLVTADEMKDPSDARIDTYVNGSLIRSGSTSEMIMPLADIVAAVSRHLTLQPGTVILTGAPPAVGEAVRLKAGDEVAVEIEGIGRLVNPVESA